MKPETRSFYEQAVQRATEIVGNLDDALDLETLADGAGLSPFHFHRMFRGMVGETPLELVRRLRMERAARQVLANDRPITQIAFDAGYETHESFTRAFRVFIARRRPASGGESTLEPRSPRRAGCTSATTVRVHSSPEIQEAGRWLVEIKEMPEFRIADRAACRAIQPDLAGVRAACKRVVGQPGCSRRRCDDGRDLPRRPG